MALDPGSKLGAYEILSPLGAGGMGEVYAARDSKLDRRVAIKILPEQFAEDESFRARFEREAKALAALSHPNILAVYDFGNANGVFYTVMELLEGETLASLLRSGVLSSRKAVDFALQVAQGLSAAHDKGIVHRDLKPDNLFVTTDGRVKILDFGLAKQATPFETADDSETRARETSPGSVLGTVGYMSPEQVRGLDTDARSDIFSLGAVLYEMLAGGAPFASDSAADTVSGILHKDTTIPTDREIPPGLARIVVRCLEKSPAGRFQSARDLAFALETLSGVGKDPGQRAPESGPRESRSIAVLPFVDMSPGKDQDYFCEGMAEEIMNALANLPGLRVAARSSAFRFKGGGQDLRSVGQALDVKTVLEGSVRTAGSRLRVTAQLNEVVTGYQIWSRRYDRQMDDVFAVQDEIAADIVEALRIEVASAESPKIVRHTQNQEAYHLYLRGRYHWYARTKGGLLKAREYYERAVEKDPGYALPHVGIADVYAIQGIYCFIPEQEAVSKAKAALDKALAINDELAEVHRSQGFIRYFYDWDFHGAVRSWQRSVELDPTSALAHIWLAFPCWEGREEVSLAALRRALQLDPLNLYVISVAGGILLLLDRHEEAANECQKALDMDGNYLLGLYFFAGACSMLGRHEEAVAALRKAAMLANRAPFYLGWLGWALARAGQDDEARSVLAELEERSKSEYVAPLNPAVIASALGETDRAFELLDEAVQKRTCWICTPRMAFFENFRSDPRFDEHLKRIGYPDKTLRRT
jgi:serine/threonine protein kinase/tetratricopeptide (TPR) repeat protein